MQRYRLVADSGLAFELQATTPTSVLQLAERERVFGGDVYQDEQFLFAFQCDEGSCWIIESTRHQPE